MAVRILSVKKEAGVYDNPYLAIDYLEWVNERINVKGITDRPKLHDWIKDENGEAYIIDEQGERIFLIAELSADGVKYVRTANKQEADYLLILPDSV